SPCPATCTRAYDSGNPAESRTTPLTSTAASCAIALAGSKASAANNATAFQRSERLIIVTPPVVPAFWNSSGQIYLSHPSARGGDSRRQAPRSPSPVLPRKRGTTRPVNRRDELPA